MTAASARKALLALGAVATMAGTPVHSAAVYDASLGTLPSSQGWLSVCALVAGTGCSQSVSGGVYTMDTGNGLNDTIRNNVQAGHSRFDRPFDPFHGYRIDFNLRVNSEAHANGNRAGFSMIFVGSDVTQSIEIGFWENEVWAYDYTGGTGGSFVKGPGAGFATNTGFNDYSLIVQQGQYRMLANGNLLFSGLLQNYAQSTNAVHAFYDIASGWFWGDDTSSARASTSMRSMQYTALRVPEPGSAALLAAALLAAGAARRVRRAQPRS